MKKWKLGAALSCAFAHSLITGAAAHAATVVNSFDNGWYSQGWKETVATKDFTATVSNINVGWNPITGETQRNWLAFDLSGLAGKNITSATLTFYGGNGNFNSPKPNETLGIFDFTGSINALVANQTNVGIFQDLGSGVSYGTQVVSGPNGPLSQFSVTLTAAAISALNAAASNASDHRFVLGGALTSLALVRDADNYYSDGSLFGIFGPQSALDQAGFLSLEVSEVPLPAALPLLASALFGGGVMAWRKKRKAKADPVAA